MTYFREFSLALLLAGLGMAANAAEGEPAAPQASAETNVAPGPAAVDRQDGGADEAEAADKGKKIIGFKNAPKPGNTAKVPVYILRTSIYLMPVRFKINGDTALKLGRGFSWFELDPGIYKFAIAGTLLNPEINLKFDFKVEAGKGPIYLLADVNGLRVAVGPITEAEALTLMEDMRYMSPERTRFKPAIELP